LFPAIARALRKITIGTVNAFVFSVSGIRSSRGGSEQNTSGSRYHLEKLLSSKEISAAEDPGFGTDTGKAKEMLQ
jgi:hypothetical protein